MRFLARPMGMVVAAIFVAFLWGSVAPAIKLGYQSLQIGSDQLGAQIVYAGYIALLAAGMLFLMLLLTKQSIQLERQLVWPVGKIAFFQIFLNYLFFFIGVSLSTGTVGSIMAGSTSFFQLLFAHFLYEDDRLTRRKIVGLIIGFIGVVLVNTSNHLQFSIGWGEIILMLSVMAGAWGNLQARALAPKLDTILMTAYAMLFSAVGLLVCGAVMVGLFPFDFSLQAGLILLYLGFLSATALLLWNQLMRLFPVSRVSLFLFLIPIFGVFISAVLLDEPLRITTFIALILVALGIFVVNRQETTRGKGIKILK